MKRISDHVAVSPWAPFLRELGFSGPTVMYGSDSIYSGGISFRGENYEIVFFGDRGDVMAYFASNRLPEMHLYSESLLGFVIPDWPVTASEPEIVSGVRKHHADLIAFLTYSQIELEMDAFRQFETWRSNELLKLMGIERPSNLALHRTHASSASRYSHRPVS